MTGISRGNLQKIAKNEILTIAVFDRPSVFDQMLRERQQRLIQKILNRNQDVEDVQGSRLDWKALIYDDRALWILSVLFKRAKMSDVGITSLEPITKKRTAMPNVDAIYLVEPTEKNLEIIASDCGEGLYNHIYINFLSSISKSMLENFASMVARQSDGSCIRFIFDQYVDFCCIDPNLFVLRESDSYLLDVYGFRAQEDVFESCCRSIAESLADVFLTTGEIPKIIYKRDSEASKQVVRHLWDKVRPMSANLEFMGSRRGSSAARKSPLLIVLDRSCDFAGGLHHPNSYEALIHDQYGIIKNQTKVGGSSFDLDPDIDPFWNQSRTLPFGQVILQNSSNVQKFKAEYGEIDQNLSATIQNLTDLQHRQRSMASHTKICTSMVDDVKAKKAQELFKLEEDCFLQRKVDVETMINVLREVRDQSDKIRFAVIAYMCDCVQKEDLDRLSSVVGCDLRFIHNNFCDFKIRTKNSQHMLGKLWSKFAAQQDDNAVALSLPIPTIVKDILEGEVDGYCDQEERLYQEIDEFKNVYVFVVGPGNYVEYNGLMYMAQKLGVNVTYGCTSIPRPSDLLSQLMRFSE